jgi:hypothetical protein
LRDSDGQKRLGICRVEVGKEKEDEKEKESETPETMVGGRKEKRLLERLAVKQAVCLPREGLLDCSVRSFLLSRRKVPRKLFCLLPQGA